MRGSAVRAARLSSPALVALLFGPLSSVAKPAEESSAFLGGATVVALTGIPGDVESERAYERQVAQLTEILAIGAGRPERVFLLVDAPERVTPPRDLPADVRSGSREGFPSLSAELKSRSGPLVVLAWGHGGLQGETPVFHVRGPRLQAEDFVKLAEAAGEGPSFWLLFFRGSGAFGRALRGPNREILTSESDVMFRSDPVGMEVLLRLLRNDPSLAFDVLAGRLGLAIAAWYEDQGLARTEEPTLWSGTETARLLAREKISSAEPPPIAGENASRPAPSVPFWDSIRPAEPSRFPDSRAVVLERLDRYVIGGEPVLTHEREEVIQILTEEGEAYGDFDVAFSPPEERVTFLDLEVRKPDGTLVRLDPDAVGESAGFVLGEYRYPSHKLFSFPGVSPGAILRVHYTTEWKRFPLPHVIVEVPLAADVPMVSHQLEVRAAQETTLHHLRSDGGPSRPEHSSSSYGTSYTWRFADVAAHADESLGFERTPRLLLSTFPDWGSFAGWYRRLIREADEITPEISAKARELTRDARTEEDKVVALYNFVTGLRYVAIPLGVNSHRPHRAANVLQNRYGDCKDKANLFNTLLRSQGIEADLVLVPRFGQAYEEAPGVGFNHAISRVRLGEEPVWVDTTDEFCRYGLLPPGDPGRKVLVIGDGSQGLVTLPPPEASAHRLELETALTLTGERPVEGELRLRARGYSDYAMRLAARSAEGETSTRPILGESFRLASGVFEMERQRFTSVAQIDRDFEWTAEGSFSGVAISDDDQGSLTAPFWIPREWEYALHARRTPLFVNQGYPLSLVETVSFKLPAGVSLTSVPRREEATEGPLRFAVVWSADENELRAELVVELDTGELSLDSTRRFQEQLRKLWDAMGREVAWRGANGGK